MGWTTPRTWSAEELTSLLLNQQLRDNLNVLKTFINDDGTLRLNYTSALANVLNSAAKTAIVSATIPGGDLVDGSLLEVTIAVLAKNNKTGGGTGTVTFGVAYAAGEISPVDGAITWSNVATEFRILWRFTLMRAGADLWVFTHGALTGSGEPGSLPDLFTGFDPSSIETGGYSTPNTRVIVAPNFAVNQTLAINLTLSAADANFYVKPQSANIRRRSL